MKATSRIVVLLVAGICSGLVSCETTDQPKPKKRPPLPGEEASELNWNRATGPNDVVTPMGLPMSR